jgi:hypothetical protein
LLDRIDEEVDQTENLGTWQELGASPMEEGFRRRRMSSNDAGADQSRRRRMTFLS